MDKKQEILRKYFGYSDFRSGQAELVNAILSGRDVMGIMPTGGGKSICYQIPALMMSGITLVISPLISLMKDQVMSLVSAGVPAAYINSSLTVGQIRKALENFRIGKYKIVYIAPERLLTENFLSAVSNVEISMIAVDESHCISEWGQDFRPSYLKIREFINLLPYRPVVSSFTATATEIVRKDIASSLGLHYPLEVITGFDRPNLFYEVIKPKNKTQKTIELLNRRRWKSGIIYCSTRKNVEKIYETVKNLNLPVAKYHAGLPEEERHKNQDDFVYDRKKIMVATNAFGMGIDKSNVSFVIHYNMPKSLEEYYQEAGRAGRDGSSAECILLYSASDIETAKFLIKNTNEDNELTEEEREKFIRHELQRLDIMIKYCKTTGCLRGYILNYFGQHFNGRCDNCGNCRADITETDITAEARIILSCVELVKAELGYSVGATLVAKILKASHDKRIEELSLEMLSAYGALRQFSLEKIARIIDTLLERNYLEKNKFNALELNQKSREILTKNAKILMRSKTSEKISTVRPTDEVYDEKLYEKLSELRMSIARAASVPAFVIFSNVTLREMANKTPGTMEELLNITGVGNVKAERYGKKFLDLINSYMK